MKEPVYQRLNLLAKETPSPKSLKLYQTSEVVHYYNATPKKDVFERDPLSGNTSITLIQLFKASQKLLDFKKEPSTKLHESGSLTYYGGFVQRSR